MSSVDGIVAKVDTSTKEEATETGVGGRPKRGRQAMEATNMCSKIMINNCIESNSNSDCFSN